MVAQEMVIAALESLGGSGQGWGEGQGATRGDRQVAGKERMVVGWGGARFRGWQAQSDLTAADRASLSALFGLRRLQSWASGRLPAGVQESLQKGSLNVLMLGHPITASTSSPAAAAAVAC